MKHAPETDCDDFRSDAHCAMQGNAMQSTSARQRIWFDRIQKRKTEVRSRLTDSELARQC